MKDVEEWLVKIARSMYRIAQSRVRVNGTFSDDFLVQVELYQGLVLSPLLFFIVLEALSREIRSGWPEELLHADDLALVSETLEGLKGRLQTWKEALKSKGLRLNVKKTKIMILRGNAGKVPTEGKFPCTVWRKV